MIHIIPSLFVVDIIELATIGNNFWFSHILFDVF